MAIGLRTRMFPGRHSACGGERNSHCGSGPTSGAGSAFGCKELTVRTSLRCVGVAIVALIMLLAGLWEALAIWFHLASEPPLRALLSGGLVLLALAAMICLALRRWRVVVLYGVCFVVVLGWWVTLQPSNDRDWADDVARTASGTVESDRLVMRNVRNFLWYSDTDFEPRWETRSYDLNKLTGVDLFMSYWAGESIAHTLLSFGFSDGQHLAFSIEIRKEKTESYSALAGFFRIYELSFIAADERDLLGVRTNVRDEDVRIYRLRMEPTQARALLLGYVTEANDLVSTPRFYNSLTANCTTQIFSMIRVLQPGLPLDYRILLAGYVPDYVYDRGGLDTSIPFEALRDRSHIRGKANNIDPDFSARIREGVPVPR
jgi:hypothetical protein